MWATVELSVEMKEEKVRKKDMEDIDAALERFTDEEIRRMIGTL
jgi:hypothetical protein